MKLKELIEKRDQIANQMRELHKKSVDEDRVFSSEEREQWEAMKADLEKTEEKINRSREIEAMNGFDTTVVNSLEGESTAQKKAERSESDYSAAFDVYMRRGYGGLTEEQREILAENRAEHRAQSQGTDSEGGYTVPTSFSGFVIETMKRFGGIMGQATIIPTDGAEPIEFPTVDDTSNSGSGVTAENAAVADQDIVFGEKILNAYIYPSGVVKVSKKLLSSERVNLEQVIGGLMGKRIGRASAAHFATGTGSSQPEGITVGSTAGATAAAAAAIAYTDITNLEASLDPAYQNGAKFVMNQSTLKAFKDLVDSEGRPLWLPGLAQRAPATILGYEYVIDNGMPNIATTTIPIVFGDLSSYHVREAGGLIFQRLVERYAENLQVGFIAHAMLDGKVMDGAAIKRLTMA